VTSKLREVLQDAGNLLDILTFEIKALFSTHKFLTIHPRIQGNIQEPLNLYIFLVAFAAGL
jgi:hypothetical protein